MSTASLYTGSTFKEVRDQVFSDPYTKLPLTIVTLKSFYSGLRYLFLEASRRRVTQEGDLVPPFQKLVHPNGIALTGTWNITQPSPYSGYFRTGARGLIIARCSTLLSETRQGHARGFAFAGKIFPTMNPNEKVKTGNFVTIDVLAGTKARYFTDVALTNAPAIGFSLTVVRLAGVVISGTAGFILADFNPAFRPIYPIAELGLKPGETVSSPKWMMIRAWPGSGKVDRVDFRDELQVKNYNNGVLRFEISVASSRLPTWERDWRYIGHIDLTESVASESCDHRLVFKHPQLLRGKKSKDYSVPSILPPREPAKDPRQSHDPARRPSQPEPDCEHRRYENHETHPTHYTRSERPPDNRSTHRDEGRGDFVARSEVRLGEARHDSNRPQYSYLRLRGSESTRVDNAVVTEAEYSPEPAQEAEVTQRAYYAEPAEPPECDYSRHADASIIVESEIERIRLRPRKEIRRAVEKGIALYLYRRSKLARKRQRCEGE